MTNPTSAHLSGAFEQFKTTPCWWRSMAIPISHRPSHVAFGKSTINSNGQLPIKPRAVKYATQPTCSPAAREPHHLHRDGMTSYPLGCLELPECLPLKKKKLTSSGKKHRAPSSRQGWPAVWGLKAQVSVHLSRTPRQPATVASNGDHSCHSVATCAMFPL